MLAVPDRERTAAMNRGDLRLWRDFGTGTTRNQWIGVISGEVMGRPQITWWTAKGVAPRTYDDDADLMHRSWERVVISGPLP
jgi:hypothetical protein